MLKMTIQQLVATSRSESTASSSNSNILLCLLEEIFLPDIIFLPQLRELFTFCTIEHVVRHQSDSTLAHIAVSEHY